MSKQSDGDAVKQRLKARAGKIPKDVSLVDELLADRRAANPHDRQVLSQMVVQLFDHWQLTTADQCMLLGLAPTERASLSRYREGQPIAADRDLLERCGHLLAIHQALRILYPENREVVYSWMTHPNKAFDDQRPIDFIRAHGLEGLRAVRRYLDSRRDQ